jgi:MacB-like periplasmic core domain
MAYYSSREAVVVSGSAAEYARVARVSPEFFRVFAVEPILGRCFTAEEMKPGGAGALMISYAYWQSNFAGGPRVLGQTVRVFGPRPITGVLPPGFRFPKIPIYGFRRLAVEHQSPARRKTTSLLRG